MARIGSSKSMSSAILRCVNLCSHVSGAVNNILCIFRLPSIPGKKLWYAKLFFSRTPQPQICYRIWGAAVNSLIEYIELNPVSFFYRNFLVEPDNNKSFIVGLYDSQCSFFRTTAGVNQLDSTLCSIQIFDGKRLLRVGKCFKPYCMIGRKCTVTRRVGIAPCFSGKREKRHCH